jgi:hypothetical protein
MRESLEAITQQCILSAWIIEKIKEDEENMNNRKPQPYVEVPQPPYTGPDERPGYDDNSGVVIVPMDAPHSPVDDDRGVVIMDMHGLYL